MVRKIIRKKIKLCMYFMYNKNNNNKNINYSKVDYNDRKLECGFYFVPMDPIRTDAMRYDAKFLFLCVSVMWFFLLYHCTRHETYNVRQWQRQLRFGLLPNNNTQYIVDFCFLFSVVHCIVCTYYIHIIMETITWK